jgi:predicted oxidoreductase
VNDDESIRAIHRAFDLGVIFFDTADVYGAGHSERVLARAFNLLAATMRQIDFTPLVAADGYEALTMTRPGDGYRL